MDNLYTPFFKKHLKNSCTEGPGPHLLCKVILYFFAIGLLINCIGLILNIVNKDKNKNASRLQKSMLYQIVIIAVNAFWIFFIYNMCYICRGWLAFFSYLALSFVSMLFISLLFKDGGPSKRVTTPPRKRTRSRLRSAPAPQRLAPQPLAPQRLRRQT